MSATKPPAGAGGLEWLDDLHFQVDGVGFVAAAMLAPDAGDDFVIVKPPELVRRYVELVDDEQPRRVVEIGVKRGGSTALLALVADPEVLVAVELDPACPPGLAELIADRGLAVELVLGVDQGDRAALVELVERFGPFDLVIDDASHLLGPTRTSFEVLFPALRPGGLYVVEDWANDWDIATALARLHPGADDLPERFGSVNSIFYDTLNRPHNVPAEVHAQIEAFAGAAMREDPSRSFLECVAQAVDRPEIAAAFPHATSARRPLADLAIELTMICASTDGVVAELQIDQAWACVRRGAAELSGFRLDDCWLDFFGYLGH